MLPYLLILLVVLKQLEEDGFLIVNGETHFLEQNDIFQSLNQKNWKLEQEQTEKEVQNFQGSNFESQSSTPLTQSTEMTHNIQAPPKPRRRTSNFDFKKCFGPLRKFRSLRKLKKNSYENQYYSKSYFFLSIQWFQKQGLLHDCYDYYRSSIEKKILEENGITQLSKNVIQCYKLALKSFDIYMEGNHIQAIKTFYKKDQGLRHKSKLQMAIKQFKEQRRKNL